MGDDLSVKSDVGGVAPKSGEVLPVFRAPPAPLQIRFASGHRALLRFDRVACSSCVRVLRRSVVSGSSLPLVPFAVWDSELVRFASLGRVVLRLQGNPFANSSGRPTDVRCRTIGKYSQRNSLVARGVYRTRVLRATTRLRYRIRGRVLGNGRLLRLWLQSRGSSVRCIVSYTILARARWIECNTPSF